MQPSQALPLLPDEIHYLAMCMSNTIIASVELNASCAPQCSTILPCAMQKTDTPVTVTFVDEYCQRYQDLFPDVRIGNTSSFCMWAYSQRSNARRCPPSRRQLAIVIPRRSTTRVAEAPWSVEELRTRRLTLLGQALAGRSFVLCMDETGDRKKSNTTDYVAHQS